MTPPANKNFNPNETKIVILLSLLAALHVFIFTAAFPFFNSVDEQLHFDLVVRYSQGEVPRGVEHISPEAIRYVALFSSRAFLADPATLPGGQLPTPLWRQPMEQAMPQLGERAAQWREVVNAESTLPPLYYAVAGAWWKAGKAVNISNERLLYWLRFLNIPVVMAVVWLGWFTARKIFPENLFVRLTVPALIALMPQTAFYSINNDIFAPLVFGTAFLLLLKFWDTKIPTTRLAAACGLTLAATFLTKINTLPLLAVSALFIAAKIFQISRDGKLHQSILPLFSLAVYALLPMLTWMLWCKTHYGDFTGSAVKIREMGWTDRPVAEWLHHPLFTLRGLWTFVGDNLATFWQGEFLWLRQPLAIPALDMFYKIFTIVLLVLALVALLKRRQQSDHVALWLAFACLAASLAFFALLSVKYDFQDCFYPSRAHPFFTSGRLLLGGLIPILVLCATGLDFALQKFPQRTKIHRSLAALLIFMLAGEIVVDWRVFHCEYNWYHL